MNPKIQSQKNGKVDDADEQEESTVTGNPER